MAFHGAYVKTKSDWAMCEFAKPNLPSAESAVPGDVTRGFHPPL